MDFETWISDIGKPILNIMEKGTAKLIWDASRKSLVDSIQRYSFIDSDSEREGSGGGCWDVSKNKNGAYVRYSDIIIGRQIEKDTHAPTA